MADPTNNPVEAGLIRCIECEHWDKRLRICLYPFGLSMQGKNSLMEYSYCSYAKRRNKQ